MTKVYLYDNGKDIFDMVFESVDLGVTVTMEAMQVYNKAPFEYFKYFYKSLKEYEDIIEYNRKKNIKKLYLGVM